MSKDASVPSVVERPEPFERRWIGTAVVDDQNFEGGVCRLGEALHTDLEQVDSITCRNDDRHERIVDERRSAPICGRSGGSTNAPTITKPIA